MPVANRATDTIAVKNGDTVTPQQWARIQGAFDNYTESTYTANTYTTTTRTDWADRTNWSNGYDGWAKAYEKLGLVIEPDKTALENIREEFGKIIDEAADVVEDQRTPAKESRVTDLMLKKYLGEG